MILLATSRVNDNLLCQYVTLLAKRVVMAGKSQLIRAVIACASSSRSLQNKYCNVQLTPWLLSGGKDSRVSSCMPSQLRQFSAGQASASGAEEEHRRLQNKVLYRARQRGFLELDLLVGLWAEAAVPQMGPQQLAEFVHVLDQENPDLFKWLTGQLPPPAEMTDNATFVALLHHVQKQMAAHRPPSAAASPGAEWVRGWDDSWRGSVAKAETATEAGVAVGTPSH